MERMRKAILRFVETGEENLKVEEEVTEWLFKQISPQNLELGSPHSILENMEREFTATCVWLKTEGVPDPKNLSCYEFEQHLIFFRKRYEKMNRR